MSHCFYYLPHFSLHLASIQGVGGSHFAPAKKKKMAPKVAPESKQKSQKWRKAINNQRISPSSTGLLTEGNSFFLFLPLLLLFPSLIDWLIDSCASHFLPISPWLWNAHGLSTRQQGEVKKMMIIRIIWKEGKEHHADSTRLWFFNFFLFFFWWPLWHRAKCE